MDAEVHYLTKPSFSSIVEANPYVDRVITLSDQFEKMMILLKGEEYDHVIDLHHNLRSSRIKLGLGKPSTAFRKLNIEKWLMVNFKINKLPELHIVDRYLDAVSFLDIKSDGGGLDFIIPAEKKVNIHQSFSIHPHSYAAIVIGAAHATKCMTSHQIARLCELLPMPVVLLGGRQEFAKGEEIRALSSAILINACGPFDIFQSASILEQAATVITHDTGLMHIAAALQKTQIVVWGNTIPGFGMTPYYGAEATEWISFEQSPKCRPCSKLGYDKCPKGHFKCMLDHNLNDIANAAIHLIKVRS
jgi:ADP-heptose:LPS heptosyltransferase